MSKQTNFFGHFFFVCSKLFSFIQQKKLKKLWIFSIFIFCLHSFILFSHSYSWCVQSLFNPYEWMIKAELLHIHHFWLLSTNLFLFHSFIHLFCLIFLWKKTTKQNNINDYYNEVDFCLIIKAKKMRWAKQPNFFWNKKEKVSL